MNQKIMKIYIYYLLSKSRTRIKDDAILNQIPVAAHDFLDYGYSVVSSKDVTAGEHGHHLWRLGIDPTQHYPVLTGNFSSDC